MKKQRRTPRHKTIIGMEARSQISLIIVEIYRLDRLLIIYLARSNNVSDIINILI